MLANAYKARLHVFRTLQYLTCKPNGSPLILEEGEGKQALCETTWDLVKVTQNRDGHKIDEEVILEGEEDIFSIDRWAKGTTVTDGTREKIIVTVAKGFIILDADVI